MNHRRAPHAFDLALQQARRLLIVGFGALALAALALQPAAAQSAEGVQTPTSSSPTTPAQAASAEEAPPQGGLSIGVAFARADGNGDGQLSPQEASRLPAISMRFAEFDSDASGQLNMMEFETGALRQP